MKRIVFLGALALTSLLSWVSCRSSARQSEASDKHSVTNNESLIKRNNKPKNPTRTEIKAAKTTIEKLMPNFSCHDVIEGESYCHNDIFDFSIMNSYAFDRNPNFSMASISTYIYVNTMHCKSIFWSNKIIHHEEMIIDIDGKIMTADGDNDDQDLFQCFNAKENDILYFIAANPNKEVRVRLVGGGGQFYYILDKAQQEAICQTVELYDALMLLRRTGIDPRTGRKSSQMVFSR